MRLTLYISLILNVLFMIFLGIWINKRGGWTFVQQTMGWKEERIQSSYSEIKQSIFSELPVDSTSLVFLGNSLTDYAHWEELFPGKSIKNRGIGGDDILGVHARVDQILSGKPKKVFLMIGTNDLEYVRNTDSILFRYERLVQKIRKTSPETQLFLQSVLPTKGIPQRPNDKIQVINKGIKGIATKNKLVFLDLFPLFTNENGELDAKYSIDGLHLNGKGYVVWRDALFKHLED